MHSHRGHGTRTLQDRGGGKLAGWRPAWYLCNVLLWCVLAEPVWCVGVAPVPLCAEATGGDQISSSRSVLCPISVRRGLSPGWKLIFQLALGLCLPLLLSFPRCWKGRHRNPHLAFYMSFGDLNSSPHACTSL